MAITFPENKNLYTDNNYKLVKLTPSNRGTYHQCAGLLVWRGGFKNSDTDAGMVRVQFLDDTTTDFDFNAADVASTGTHPRVGSILPMRIKRIVADDTGTGTDTSSDIYVGNYLYGVFLDKETLEPNQPPVFGSTQYTFSVDRRASSGTAVGTITWSDPDGDGSSVINPAMTADHNVALNDFTGTSPFTLDVSTGAITYTREASGSEPEHSVNLLFPVTIQDDFTADQKSTIQNVILIINPADAPNITSVDVNDSTTTLGNSGATASFSYTGYIDEAVFDAFVLVDRTTAVRINGDLVAGGSYTLPLNSLPVENYMIQFATTTAQIVSTAEDGVSSSSYTVTFDKWSPGTSPLPLSANTYDGISIAGYNALTLPTWDPFRLRYILDPIHSQERQNSFNVRVQSRNNRQLARFATAASNDIGGTLTYQNVNFRSSHTLYRYGDLRTDDDAYNLDHLIIEVIENENSKPTDFTGTPDGRSMYDFLIRSRDPEIVQRVRLATSTDFAADSFFDGSTFDPDTRAYTGIEYPNGTTEIHVEVRRAPRREQTIVANIGTLGTSDTAISTGGGNTKTGTLTVSGTHTLSIRTTAGGRARDADGTTAATGNQGDYTFAISEATP